MRRLGRAIFLCGVLLATLAAAGWLAGYWRIGARWHSWQAIRIDLLQGKVRAVVYDGNSPREAQLIGFYGWETDPLPAFFTMYAVKGATLNVYIAELPLWIPLMLGLGAVAVGQRLARLDLNRCPKCNYDRQGLTVDVCPECGQALRAVGFKGKIRSLQE